jgi:hypothetical protein
MEDKVGNAAREVGAEHGKSKASWAAQFNLTPYAAGKLLDGIEEGDPVTMDICPNPLSGEWADDPPAMHILEAIATKCGSAGSGDDDILDLYEEAFREAFWAEVTRVCKAIRDGERDDAK